MKLTQKRKQTKVICHHCKKRFLKDSSEVNRNKKLNRNNYCSHKCCGISIYKNNLLDEYGKVKNLRTDQLRFGSSKDEFSDFRPYLRNARRRGHEINIDLLYLKQIWENQKGICPYTGVSLKHCKLGKNSDHIFTASLDRIDSSKGYVVDNVQFVSMALNFMKNDMPHNDVIQLCKIIAEKWN